MKKQLLKNIIEWDTVNWSNALRFWDTACIDYKGKKVLDIGSRNGGLSLWFALKGAEVICSDLNGPSEQAKVLHRKYNVTDKIKYECIDATNIPYIDYFDIVVFKSVLGGIGYNNNIERQQKAIDEMHKSLKTGTGVLLFAENLVASPLHSFFRIKFVKWGKSWRYVSLNELNNMLKYFSTFHYTSVGFWGAFGRTDLQRDILGYVDNIFCMLIPKCWRYIGIYIANK